MNNVHNSQQDRIGLVVRRVSGGSCQQCCPALSTTSLTHGDFMLVVDSSLNVFRTSDL